jgi:hypothetical protein
MKLCLPIISITVLLCLAGCEKPVHRMDIEPVRKQLVLNGSLGPDQSFMIHVSSSMEPVGPELVTIVEDAEVTISDDRNQLLHARYDSMGYYLADWYPETNTRYRITARAPGFEEAYADISIPGKHEGIVLSHDVNNTTYPYILKISDPANAENTYMIRARYQYKETRQFWIGPGQWRYDTIIEIRKAVLSSVDELIEYSGDGTFVGDSRFSAGEKSASGFVVSDELFNGKEHSLSFKATYIYRLDPDRPYLFIDVVSLNRDYYNFLKSYSFYYQARQTPFAEPVAILTNVRNGLGFVYGYSVHTDSVRIK